MRNLKRVLSMALASIMVLGMMVIGAGAASTYENFTDKDEILNKEAVNTMVSLGVLNGKEDGSYYDPTGIVTRGEMAKIIAVMLNGGKDPVQGSNTSTSFTDTKGNWAEPYIAFCVNQKILAGRGDGSFGPNEPVTGSAFAKAVLCALGYRADLEGMVNDLNWEMNTNVLANKVGLYEGLETIKASEGLSRDNVAQLIYNGVQAQEVLYENLYGDHSDVIQTKENGTMLANRFGVVKVEGVVVANDVFGVNDYSPAPNGKARFANCNTYALRSANGNITYKAYDAVYPVTLTNDMVGRRVVIYVKFQNNLAPNAVDSVVVGQPILSEKNVVASTGDKLKDDDKVKSFLRDHDLSIGSEKLDNDVNNDYRGVLTVNDQTFKFVDGDPALADGVNAAGTTITFIDHTGDGTVDYILKETQHLAKVTVYNESGKKLTVAGVGEIDFKNIANEEDVALNDMVLWTKYEDTYYFTKPETVSGTFAAYNKDATKMVMDDVSYGATSVKYTRDGTTLQDFTIGKDLIGESYTLYLDQYGNCIAIDLYETALPNYALVLDSDQFTGGVNNRAEVKLLLSDGGTATYTVNLLASASRWNLSGSDSVKEAAMKKLLIDPDGNGSKVAPITNTIVTYAIDESGKVILGNPAQDSSYSSLSVTAADGTGNKTVGRTISQYTFDKNKTAVNGTAVTNAPNGTKPNANTSIVVNDNTLFFFKHVDDKGTPNDTSDDVSTYTAVQGLKKLPTAPIAGSYLVSAIYRNVNDDRTSTAVARAVYVNGEYEGALDYLYVCEDYLSTIEGTIGNRIYTFNVVLDNGEKTTVKVKEGTNGLNPDSISSGEIYSYTTGTNGYTDLKQANTYTTTDTKNKTVNGYVVTYSENNSVTMEWGKDRNPATNGGNQALAFTVGGDAKVWNVEGDDPVATNLTANTAVALATDTNGFVKAAFVKDSNVVFRNFTNKTGGSITISTSGATSGSYELTSGSEIATATGFSVRITGVSANAQKIACYDKITDGGEKTTLYADSNGSGVVSISMPSYARVELYSVIGGSHGNGGGTSKTLPSTTPISDINAALREGNVTITGTTFEPDSNVIVPGDRTLTVQGNLILNSAKRLSNSGNVTVGETLKVADSTILNGDITTKKIDVTKTTTALTLDGNLTITDATGLTLAGPTALAAGKTLTTTALDLNGQTMTCGTGSKTIVNGVLTLHSALKGGKVEAKTVHVDANFNVETDLLVKETVSNSGSYSLTVKTGGALVVKNEKGEAVAAKAPITNDGGKVEILDPVEGSYVNKSGEANVPQVKGTATIAGGTGSVGTIGTTTNTLTISGGNVEIAASAGNVTVSGGKAEIVGEVKGNLTASGEAEVTIAGGSKVTGTVDNQGTGNVVIENGAETGGTSGNVTTDKNTTVKLTGTLTGGTYDGAVEIVQTDSQDATLNGTLTLNGSVKGLQNLTISSDKDAKAIVKFGAGATVSESDGHKFVDKNGSTATVFAGKTFAWDTDKFVSDTDGAPAVKNVQVIIVHDQTSWTSAVSAGMPDEWSGRNEGKGDGEAPDDITTDPWIVVIAELAPGQTIVAKDNLTFKYKEASAETWTDVTNPFSGTNAIGSKGKAIVSAFLGTDPNADTLRGDDLGLELEANKEYTFEVTVTVGGMSKSANANYTTPAEETP